MDDGLTALCLGAMSGAHRTTEALLSQEDHQPEMKRLRESDDDGPDDVRTINSMLELELPESSRVRDAQHRSNGSMDDPVLECKHRIFLSHSGHQKDFVENLCEDLEKVLRFPFFDRRPSSLPKGERFPELILTAARQCQMGVVVVSEEYFMSKWPMIELDAFVQTWLTQKEQQLKTKLKILPLFYKLSLVEFEKEERRAAWYSKWEDLAKKDKRININSWKDSLRLLKEFNGIEYYPRTTGLKAYREEIVKQICNEVPADVKWDDSHVQGGSKLCQVIQEAISGVQPSEQYGVRVIGVFGVGGMGKTTLCKILWNKLFGKYDVKSSHVELGSKRSLKLLKEVLKDLTNTDQVSVKRLDEGQCWNLLKNACKQKIFLAIDNVWPDSKSLEEAKKYLKLGFHKESVVIVTSRAFETLTSLGVSKADCFAMPSLEEEDAKNLLLYHATSCNQVLNDNDKQAIKECIQLCYFSNGKRNDRHYLPLALKALGLQLGCIDKRPSEWVKALEEVRDFNPRQDKENPVYSILRSSFDSLKLTEQNLFMDLVLFPPGPFRDYESGDELPPSVGLMEWLALVHNQSLQKIGNMVQRLKERGLVEDVDMGAQEVYMHDLYREFAKLEASGKLKDLDFEERRWAWYENSYPTELLEMMPSRGRWQNLTRVSVVEWDDEVRRSPFEGIEWTNLSNVVVLKIRWDGAHPGDLDLKGLRCLKSLELDNYYPRNTLDGLQDLRHLVYFKWDCSGVWSKVWSKVFLGKLPASLKVLLLEGSAVSLGSGVFDLCFNLAKLELRYCRARNLDFRNCSSLESLQLLRLQPVLEGVSELDLYGLQDLSKLTFFSWKRFDDELEAKLGRKFDLRLQCQLPASLQVLNIVENVSLRSDVFARCTKLSELYLRFCRAEGLDLSNCTSLESPVISELDQRMEQSFVAVTEASLERLDDLTDFNRNFGNSIRFPASLKVLRASDVRVSLGSDAFDLCSNLAKVELINCRAGNLDFRNCSSLESLKLVRLQPVLKGVAELCVSGLQDLSNLTRFIYRCSGKREFCKMQGQFPSSLEVLEIHRTVLVTADVFDLCVKLSFLKLQDCRAVANLDLRKCSSLQSLQIVRLPPDLEAMSDGSHCGLQDRNLTNFSLGCATSQKQDCSADQNLDFRYCKYLRTVRLTKVDRLCTLSGLSSSAATLKHLIVNGCDNLDGIPGLDQLVSLERLYLRELCVFRNLRLSDLSCLTNLKELHLNGTDLELREEDVCMLASLPELNPVCVGEIEDLRFRVDVKQRKVLKLVGEIDDHTQLSLPRESWFSWTKRQERDLGELPISLRTAEVWATGDFAPLCSLIIGPHPNIHGWIWMQSG